MKYEITKITDYDGNIKEERMGCIVSIKHLDVGENAIFIYEDGTPHFGFMTSTVKYIHHDIGSKKNTYTIETENSVYYLESES